MSIRATVSATFPTLGAAESAMAALLRSSFHPRDVVLTRGDEEPSYMVSVVANERVREVEDLLRRYEPSHWRTSIHDTHEPVAAEAPELLRLSPEADRLEQDAPWLEDVSEPAGARPANEIAEADWIEQRQSLYAAPSSLPQESSRAMAHIPEADYAEQVTSAYREPPESETA